MNKDIMEKVYTSTSLKLIKHMDVLGYASQGVWRPIVLQIAPTDKCNLKCSFCSVWKRKGDEIPFEELEKCVKEFKQIGIKSAELTGGGDPTMYPQINELIELLDKLGIQIGMITNGLALNKVKSENLQKLKWLRISLSALDFPNIETKFVDTIKMLRGTLGFSYVWNDKSTEDTLKTIQSMAEEYGAEYVRIVPNCLNAEEQEKYKAEITPLVEQYPTFFFQSKPYDVYPECRIGYLKPFLNADGYLYHCSAAPLYTGYFSEDWRICHMSEVLDKWCFNLPKMDTSHCCKGKCFYSKQNELLHSLEVKVPHEKFI